MSIIILCSDAGDVTSAVQNLTVLSVGATSITVGWSVSPLAVAIVEWETFEGENLHKFCNFSTTYETFFMKL